MTTLHNTLLPTGATISEKQLFTAFMDTDIEYRIGKNKRTYSTPVPDFFSGFEYDVLDDFGARLLTECAADSGTTPSVALWNAKLELIGIVKNLENVLGSFEIYKHAASLRKRRGKPALFNSFRCNEVQAT